MSGFSEFIGPGISDDLSRTAITTYVAFRTATGGDQVNLGFRQASTLAARIRVMRAQGKSNEEIEYRLMLRSGQINRILQQVGISKAARVGLKGKFS